MCKAPSDELGVQHVARAAACSSRCMLTCTPCQPIVQVQHAAVNLAAQLEAVALEDHPLPHSSTTHIASPSLESPLLVYTQGGTSSEVPMLHSPGMAALGMAAAVTATQLAVGATTPAPTAADEQSELFVTAREQQTGATAFGTPGISTAGSGPGAAAAPAGPHVEEMEAASLPASHLARELAAQLPGAAGSASGRKPALGSAAEMVEGTEGACALAAG